MTETKISEAITATNFGNGAEKTVSEFFQNTLVDPDQFSAVLTSIGIDTDESDAGIGSALVRVSLVPIPASIWLFGTGLLCIFQLGRNKRS